MKKILNLRINYGTAIVKEQSFPEFKICKENRKRIVDESVAVTSVKETTSENETT